MTDHIVAPQSNGCPNPTMLETEAVYRERLAAHVKHRWLEAKARQEAAARRLAQEVARMDAFEELYGAVQQAASVVEHTAAIFDAFAPPLPPLFGQNGAGSAEAVRALAAKIWAEQRGSDNGCNAVTAAPTGAR